MGAREKNQNRRHKDPSGILTVTGFILMSVPALFPEREAAVCICSLSGWFVFLLAERAAAGKKQLRFTVVFFALSFVCRYFGSFGTGPRYLALSCLAALLIGFLNSLVLLFNHLLVRKGHRYLSVPAVPAVYVLVQYLLISAGLGNFYDPLGYCLVIPFYSMNLSLIGEYGLTFATALILSLLAAGVSESKSRKSIAALLLGLGFAAVFTAAGDLLLNAEREPDTVLRVAVATSFEDDMEGTMTEQYTAEDWQQLFQKSVEVAAENQADLLVLSEEFYAVRKSREEEVMDDVSATVKKYGIPVLVCFEVWGEEEEKSVNKAVLFDGQGRICMTYVKNNLVPVLESSEYEDGPEEPGSCTLLLGGTEVNIAAVICFDISDADYIHKIPQDTELLLVPAWEWDTANLEQRRMRMRSVELGTTVLKHTYEGFTFVSGPWGLCGEMQDNRGIYETVRMIDVPVWEKQPAG